MLERSNNTKAWLYLAPALIFLFIFTIYPVFNTFFISFQSGYNYLNPFDYGTFTFGNYTQILTYSVFLDALKTTLIIVFVTVPLSTIIALLIALGLNAIKPLRKVFETIFFLPYVTNALAIGMVFSVLFSYNTYKGQEVLGLVNHFLVNVLNLDSVNFLTGSYFSGMLVLLIYITWNSLAFKVLIFLGGLQGIDKQYYQAAKIDNAGKVRTFFKITVPLLSPILSYILITSLIGAFKEYSSVIAIFGADAETSQFGTVVTFIYRFLKPSYISIAAAGAVILLVIILFFTAINLYVSKKKVHY